jgi:hypothetical protein
MARRGETTRATTGQTDPLRNLADHSGGMLSVYSFFTTSRHICGILLSLTHVSRGFALLRVLFGTMEDAKSEQVKLCSPIHASLEQFESCDLPLRLTAAPRQRQTSKDGVLVLSHPGSK